MMVSGAALAAPGGQASSTGSASATLLRAINIAAVADLRFGQIAAPNAPCTITASHSGATTGSGSSRMTAGPFTNNHTACSSRFDTASKFALAAGAALSVAASEALAKYSGTYSVPAKYQLMTARCQAEPCHRDNCVSRADVYMVNR